MKQIKEFKGQNTADGQVYFLNYSITEKSSSLQLVKDIFLISQRCMYLNPLTSPLRRQIIEEMLN